MAKRVIQLYDKYKSTTKVYPLIVGESITPDAKDKIDDIIEDNIVANPTPAGGETTLAYLEIGGTKYAIPVPTTVVANPTLAGTEADLGSIQIGETKYKIGGGKQLYRHCIVANADFSTYGYTYHLTFDIINDNANALNTNVKIAEYLYNHDIKWDSGLTKMLPISGWILLTGQPAGNPNGVCIPQGLQGSYSGPGGYVLSVVNIIDTDGNSSTSAGSTINNATFTDTVIAL